MKDLWLRLRAVLFPWIVERELDEELDFHVEMQVRKNLQAGMPEAEARRQARLQFGRDAAVREECRQARGISLLETTLQDIRYAMRGLRRTPTFALAVIATVGLGLGVNTAIFTIFNAYVLRPLMIRDPHSVYLLTWLTRGGQRHAFTWPQYRELEAAKPAMAELHAVRGLPVRIGGHQYFGELVTGNYFQMLGVGVQLGRPLRASDSGIPGREPVLVLSAAAWRRLFAADPDIVGKKLPVHGYPVEVIGVAQEGFDGLGDVQRDFWAPITLYRQLASGPDVFGPQSPELLYVIVRLQKGVSERRAQALLNTWIGRITPDAPMAERAASVTLESRATPIHLSPEALVVVIPILAAFGLVLLIACANVANMMLARAMARQREIGIRLSLGAARWRMIRQLLTESLVLAIPGGLLGFVISQFALEGAVRLLFVTLPPEFAEFVRLAPLTPDARVFVFMIGAAATAGVLFGLAPAIQGTRSDVVSASRGDFGNDFRPQRLRSALVVFQIAVCSMLLICSGLLLVGANRIHNIQLGFQIGDIVWMRVVEKDRERILAGLAREPLVGEVAGVQTVPLTGFSSARASSSSGESAKVNYNAVSPEFFHALGVGIDRGRNFTREEAAGGAPVAIVSEVAARRLWPDRDAIGQSVRFNPQDSVPAGPYRVIGIARDINPDFDEAPGSRGLIYLPADPHSAQMDLLLRVKGDPELARQHIDRSLGQQAPGGVDRIHRLQELRAGKVYPFEVAYWVSALLGMLALLLTVSGIYGVVSYVVEQRAREMGIRMALGATAGSLVAMVVRQALRLGVWGIALGGVMALGFSRILASELVLAPSSEWGAFGAGFGIVMMACLAAAFVPSRRAARADPMHTLRHD